MGIFLVFSVMVLGYFYTEKNLTVKIELKRKAGWETYFFVGMHGLNLVFKGITLALFFYLILISAEWVVNETRLHFFPNANSWDWTSWLKSDFEYFEGLKYAHIFVLFFAFIFSFESKEEGSQEKTFEKLKQLDSILEMTVTAFKEQKQVRVSLKSRKVYVGLIDGDQLGNADMENLILIPYFSGYRDKDTLNLHFERNYVRYYDSYDLNIDQDIERMREFRVAIRMSEVEAMSFFDKEAYAEFNQNQVSGEQPKLTS